MSKQRNITLIETSVQYEKLKVNKYLLSRKIAGQGVSFRTSYFVLYEYKSGLIRNLIDYYHIVKILEKPSEAFAYWAERFKIREIKNHTLLHGIILRLAGKIDGDNDVKLYLAQLEQAIAYALDVFYEDIEKWTVGYFSSDSIVEYQIKGAESYQDFLTLHNSRKAIPLSEFWVKNEKKLNKILQAKENAPKQYAKKYTQLELVAADKEATKNVHLNNALGDAVICVDTPLHYTLATTDGYQAHLRDVLEGRCKRVDRVADELRKKLAAGV